MDSLSKPIITTPRSSRENKLVNNIAQNKTVHSNDLIIRKSANGTTISLKPKYKQGWGTVNYTGEFDPDAYYTVGDMTRVLPDVEYTDYLGNTIPAVPGGWICVVDVPDHELSDALILASNVDDNYTPYLRQAGIIYYPILPEPETLASLTNLNGRYWDAFPPLTLASGCDNAGNFQTFYAAEYASGSIG